MSAKRDAELDAVVLGDLEKEILEWNNRRADVRRIFCIVDDRGLDGIQHAGLDKKHMEFLLPMYQRRTEKKLELIGTDSPVAREYLKRMNRRTLAGGQLAKGKLLG
jgi:hypothetical protein